MVISNKDSVIGDPPGGVRDRLLDAAEKLFAERGFNSTSIRDLAAAAGCNIASVNYYFGGKEKLYVEIWRRYLLMLRETYVGSIDKMLSEGEGKPDLEELLRTFAYAFIGPWFDENGGSRLIKLMAREMLNPHLPSSMFGRDVIMPTLSAMQTVLAKACPELPRSKVPLIMFSLVGQLIHTIRLKTMLGSMNDDTLPRLEPAEVINHIVVFSAAGIRAYAGGETI